MSDYYLQPAAVGLPAGFPTLKHQPQADGRLSIFAGETAEYRVWVEPLPAAWSKPGLYSTEPPTMPTGNQPTTTTNYGVNIQGLKPHEGRVETNDPAFMPNLQTNLNPSTAAGQQVPLPLDGGGPAGGPSTTLIVLGIAALLALLVLFAPRGHRRS